MNVPDAPAHPLADRRAASRLALQSAALAVLLSWPTLPRLLTAAVGSPDTDTPKHLWTLWWMRRELWDGPFGLRTTWVNYPDGIELYPISPLDGLLHALLPLPPIAASNLLALLHLLLLGLFAGWLGAEVVRTRAGAHVASALAQGAAFTGFALEVGVGELRLSWWIPLGLALLVHAHRVRTHGAFVALGFALAGAVLSCFYHGLFLAVSTAVWALVTLERRRELLVGYALAAGLSLAVVLPVVRVFASSYATTDAQVLFPGASVGLDELLTPDAFLPTVSAYAGGRYLGIVACLLAMLGVLADRRRALPWLAVAVVTGVLALGPVLSWAGVPIVANGTAFVLPMKPLNAALAALGEPINFPARFLAPAMVALAVLGALATRWRGAAWLVPLALLDIAVNDRVAWPRATFAPPALPGFVEARGEGAVADLSMVASVAEPGVRTRSIAAQLALNQPFATVPVERLVEWGGSGVAWLRALPLVQAVLTAQQRTLVSVDPAWRDDLWLLRDRGYDRLLVTHHTDSPDQRVDKLLTELCGAPVRTHDATLWTIPAHTPTADPATLRATHARRVALQGGATGGAGSTGAFVAPP